MANSQNMASMAATQICNQIASKFSKPTHPYPDPLNLLVTEVTTVASQNGSVFLYGVGREGLMLKALCMRLAHLVFDMTTPPIIWERLWVRLLKLFDLDTLILNEIFIACFILLIAITNYSWIGVIYYAFVSYFFNKL